MEAQKVTVELDWDTVDNIVKKELISLKANLVEDLKKRKAGKGMAIFDTDKTTDVALIKEHIEAFDTILKYYGVKDE
jgi:hypothetical protein